MIFVQNIINRFDTNNLRTAKANGKSTSYTVGKGDSMHICTKDLNGDTHDLDVIKFVFIHELAHVGSDEWDHKDIFWA